MKSRFLSRIVVFMVVAACGRLMAQTSAPASSELNPAAVAVKETPAVELSYGAEEILKLARAKVSDDVIAAFIKSTGRVYRLNVTEILYLREQGVSDSALTAMLDSQKNAPPPVSQPPPAAAPVAVSTQPAQVVTQPVATYSAPVYVEPAPVYVYPSSSYYYNSWPYYYGSYWSYPRVSFSFGFGSGYYCGAPYRGYYGYYGGARGGGYHGGGHPPPSGGRPPGGQPPAGRPSGGFARR